MYQVIDDPEDEARTRGGFSVLPFLIGAALAGLVFFIVWLASPGQPTEPGESVETPASRDAYLQALSEPTPALRRARLLDIQRTHPDSERMDAILAQLDVIQAAELRDWEALTQSVYDVRANAQDKRDALLAYETRWNRALLGGRGADMEALEAEIDETAEAQPLPDRSLDPGNSPIPNTVPSDTLAGAPPTYRSPVLFTPSAPPVQTPQARENVVQPSVRRNVSPRYPRKARRRNIGAVVTVALDIDERGRVAMAEIVSVEAERYADDFVKAAERAALRTRFNPKTVNGLPVAAVGVRKRYIFRVDN